MEPFRDDKSTTDTLRLLADKITPEERQRINDILRSCSAEVAVTRGIPIGLGVLGGLHFARNKLPPELRSGPRRWLFAVLVGSGGMMLCNLLFGNTCIDRLQPITNELRQKVGLVNYLSCAISSIR